jgi:retron-type reverse transcriptase
VQVQKAHSLIGQVYDPRNLARAWVRVKENRGAGGVDRISIDRFAREHRRYLTVLHQRLAEGELSSFAGASGGDRQTGVDG